MATCPKGHTQLYLALSLWLFPASLAVAFVRAPEAGWARGSCLADLRSPHQDLDPSSACAATPSLEGWQSIDAPSYPLHWCAHA